MLLLDWKDSVKKPPDDGLAAEVLVKEAKTLFVTLRVCKDSAMCGKRAEEQCLNLSGKWSLAILTGETVVFSEPDSYLSAETAQEAAETYLHRELRNLTRFAEAMGKLDGIKNWKND